MPTQNFKSLSVIDLLRTIKHIEQHPMIYLNVLNNVITFVMTVWEFHSDNIMFKSLSSGSSGHSIQSVTVVLQ